MSEAVTGGEYWTVSVRIWTANFLPRGNRSLFMWTGLRHPRLL